MEEPTANTQPDGGVNVLALTGCIYGPGGPICIASLATPNSMTIPDIWTCEQVLPPLFSALSDDKAGLKKDQVCTIPQVMYNESYLVVA